MFKLNNMKTLVDLVAPPPGYRFDRGIVTTYTLELTSLLRVLLALHGYDADNEVDANPFALLKTLISAINKSNLLVFCNRGKIRSIRKDALIRLLDNTICDINIKEGKFHPKVWILKYTWKEDSAKRHNSIYRFICSSKNLTDSEYLEASFAVDGVENKASRNRNSELCEFLKETLLYADNGKRQKGRYRAFINELRKVVFDEPGNGFEYYYQFGRGRRKRLAHKLDFSRVSKAAIISPFLSEGFIKTIPKNLKDVTIVSSQSSLDSLGKKVYEKYIKNNENVYVLADDINENESSPDTETSDVSLHAKIYILEKGSVCEVWLGSANATYNGWEARNAEAMVCVKANYSVKRFMNDLIYKRDNILNGFVRRYSRREGVTIWPPEQRDIEKIASAITSCRFVLVYLKDERKVKISMHLPHGIEEKDLALLKDAGIHIKLFGYGQLHKIEIGSEVIIPVPAIEDVSDLLEITFKYRGTTNKLMLLAESDLHRYKREREAIVCKKRLLSKSKIKEYIRYILLEDKAAIIIGDGRSKRTGGGTTRYKPIVYGFSMEEILLKYSSEKIEEINRLIENTGRDNLDNEILEFWDNFQKAFAGCKR